MKYILQTPTAVLGGDERPKQTDIRDLGEGSYTLRRGDGSVIKEYRVSTNRRSNLAVENSTPTGLDGISTLQLGRMRKAYVTIVKYDIREQSKIARIDNEISQRETLIHTAAQHPLVVKA